MNFTLQDGFVLVSSTSKFSKTGINVGIYDYEKDELDYVTRNGSWYEKIDKELMKKKCREYYESEKMNEALE